MYERSQHKWNDQNCSSPKGFKVIDNWPFFLVPRCRSFEWLRLPPSQCLAAQALVGAPLGVSHQHHHVRGLIGLLCIVPLRSTLWAARRAAHAVLKEEGALDLLGVLEGEGLRKWKVWMFDNHLGKTRCSIPNEARHQRMSGFFPPLPSSEPTCCCLFP